MNSDAPGQTNSDYDPSLLNPCSEIPQLTYNLSQSRKRWIIFVNVLPQECSEEHLSGFQNLTAIKHCSSTYCGRPGDIIAACLALEAQTAFFTEYAAWNLRCRDCTWSVTFYELEDSLRPLDKLCPGLVSVRPCEVASGSSAVPETQGRLEGRGPETLVKRTYL